MTFLLLISLFFIVAIRLTIANTTEQVDVNSEFLTCILGRCWVLILAGTPAILSKVFFSVVLLSSWKKILGLYLN
jgi:hypothetical protein